MRNLSWLFGAVVLSGVAPMACGANGEAFTVAGGGRGGAAGAGGDALGAGASIGTGVGSAGTGATAGVNDAGTGAVAAAGAPDGIAGQATAGASGVSGCSGDIDCGGATPFCDAGGSCVACKTDAGCGDPLFERCDAGSCICRGELTDCSGACRDLRTDPNACGGCGTRCGRDEVCSSGVCACRPGLTECSGTCVDLKSNPSHCGGCENAACGENQRCLAGSCVATAGGCGAGLELCSFSGGRSGCVDTAASPLHCGECNSPCARDELCVDGSCRKYAPAATCDACPCNEVCQALLETNTCCGAPGGETPVCVEGSSCPE